MYCSYCGKQVSDTAAFCPNCGKSLKAEVSAPVFSPEQTKVNSLFHSVFGTDKFRLAAIFFTVATAVDAISTLIGGKFPFPVLRIFVIISLFKLNSLANAQSPFNTFASPLKTLRIIINIERIVMWVVVGLLGICGLIFLFLGSAVGSTGIAEEFFNLDSTYSFAADAELAGIIWAVLAIFIIIIAVICALLNVFMYGSFYKCAKSTEWTAGTGKYMIKKLSSTYGWLIFMIVIDSLVAFTGFISLVSGTSVFASLLSLTAVGFNIAALAIFANTVSEIKNSRQIENFQYNI